MKVTLDFHEDLTFTFLRFSVANIKKYVEHFKTPCTFKKIKLI